MKEKRMKSREKIVAYASLVEIKDSRIFLFVFKAHAIRHKLSVYPEQEFFYEMYSPLLYGGKKESLNIRHLSSIGIKSSLAFIESSISRDMNVLCIVFM